MEIDRKRSAFRQRIRKQQIEKIFKERRNLVSEEIGQQQGSYMDQVEEVVDKLPNSVHSLMRIINDEGEKVLELVEKAMPIIISTIAEVSLVQLSSYVYIVNWILVCEDEGSQKRLNIIRDCGGLIINKAFRLWDSTKLMRVQIMKIYLQFLVCLAHDISILKNVDILMITQSIRKIFTSLQPSAHQQFYQNIIIISNNVVSIPSHNTDPDHIFRIHQLKQLFISGIFHNPIVIKSLTQMAIVTDKGQRVEITLRFFINLTFVVNQAVQIATFLNGFIMMVLCYLGQKNWLLNDTSQMLLLRFINNLIVSDPKFADTMQSEGVISKMIQEFRQQKQKIVYIQFISTLSSFTTQNPQQSYLRCHELFLRSLEITHSDPEVAEKSLESIMILQNYQAQGQRIKLYDELMSYKKQIEYLLENGKRQNIINFCQALLAQDIQ